MNKPRTLLVYRAAKDGNHVAARCISCDVVSPESWESGVLWNGFMLESASAISFRVAVTDVSGGPFGPRAVYGAEEFMESVDVNARIPILVAQNATYLEIENVDCEIKCPFFVSLDEPTSPCSFQTIMDITIEGIENLPDVVDHDVRSKESIVDEWDAMAYTAIGKSIPYPVNCRFPATMISGGRECSVVYMFLEAPQNGAVRVQIESSDASVSHDDHATLVRRFRKASGKVEEVEIGKLVGSSVASR